MLRTGPASLQPQQPQFTACPDCNGSLFRVQSFVDTSKNKPVRIYKCTDCQKLVWDDCRQTTKKPVGSEKGLRVVRASFACGSLGSFIRRAIRT